MAGRLHENGAGAPSPRSALLWLAALAVVAVQAMALATRYFQAWLDGDYLLPQRFAADVAAGVYPLSGWTLSSSPYFFPDFTLSLAWHAVLGGAPLLPFYVVMSYVALALLSGWTLHRVRGTEGHGWLLGALLVNALLAWQGMADHARWLWWLGTATFHGGAVLLGLAQFGLWLGPAETAPSRGRLLTAGVLLFLGLASDTLLFTQFVAPLGGALFATAPAPRWQARRLRVFLGTAGIACLLVLLLRAGLHAAQWGNYPAVVRYAPTPSAVAAAAGQMAADLTGFITAAAPGFVALFVLSLIGVFGLTRRQAPTGAQHQAGWFAAFCLLSTLALPALAAYWRNPQHGRYLLPCLVIPLWWLLTVLPPAGLRTPLVAGIVTASLLGLASWRTPQIDFAKWGWPYPERVAELEKFLRKGEAAHGLADFWNANYLNAVARSGLRLNQLRPDGRVQFWGNNAFRHFDATSGEGPLRTPLYTFILPNGLDPAALRVKFGEPDREVTVGAYEVWLYDAAGAQRISALVDGEVRAFLGGRPGTERIAK
ncbi:MAG: hypothetical protein ACOZE5_15930 [Verrucomicrobiota bacterium]